MDRPETCTFITENLKMSMKAFEALFVPNKLTDFRTCKFSVFAGDIGKQACNQRWYAML